MDAIVMCGGRGTRLDADAEKPLYAVGGEPMIDRVLAALDDASVDDVYAATSPHAPATARHLADRPVTAVETPGDGYVADLDAALDTVGRPALTVAADVPLLAPAVVDRFLAGADGATTATVPAALCRRLGVSVDGDEPWLPAGLNVVDGGDDATYQSWDARLAVAVDRVEDAAVAERLLGVRDGR